MQRFEKPITVANDIVVGDAKPFIIAGPCAAESLDLCLEVAGHLKELSDKLNFSYIFKASFDKANRTSANSYRGPGLMEGLNMLNTIKTDLDLPIITDVHESSHVDEVAAVVDMVQIPAFLCRQTDLLVAAGKTGKAVNIKRGQFMAPADMQYAVEKVMETGNSNVSLTERGASFGYHNLVVDFRAIPTMRQYCPVIFDVTHSVQQPGGEGGSSGGQKEFAPYLARAAAAVGVDGFFVETHPTPDKALSDGPNMIPLKGMEEFLTEVLKYHNR